jgi:Tripartite tricarboxylate transporter TctB family
VRRGSVIFCVFLMAVAACAIVLARGWAFKAALFPLSVSVPLFVLATVQLSVVIFGNPETSGSAEMDVDFSTDVAPDVVRRRVLGIFAWIVAFIALVYLLGFPPTVPLFIFLYLRFQSAVSWLSSVIAAAITWACFHMLFQSLVHIQFEPGAIQTWLGM